MDNATVEQYLREQFADAVLDTHKFRGDMSIVVERAQIAAISEAMRDAPNLHYDLLENLCGVDYLGRDPRFEVVYHLTSVESGHRICLKVGVPEDDLIVPTVTSVWPTANWQEREAYDMFGIRFADHPALTRILMPDDWEGYPQRKDVPLGYEEVAFTFNQDEIYAHKPFAKE